MCRDESTFLNVFTSCALIVLLSLVLEREDAGRGLGLAVFLQGLGARLAGKVDGGCKHQLATITRIFFLSLVMVTKVVPWGTVVPNLFL